MSGVRPFPARFVLIRERDPSRVSGVGRVADGVRFADGTAVLHWHGEYASTVVWHSIGDVVAVHGHCGDTRVAWLEVPRLSDGDTHVFGSATWGQ